MAVCEEMGERQHTPAAAARAVGMQLVPVLMQARDCSQIDHSGTIEACATNALSPTSCSGDIAMNRTRFRVGIVLVTIIGVTACFMPLQSSAVVLGYVTGSDDMKLGSEQRMNWLIGALDGMMAESAAVTKNAKGPWVGRCVGNMENSQVRTIFERELAAKPESWHAPAAFILRASLQAACKSN